MLETLITAVVDELKEYIPNIYKHKTRITVAACILGFLLGLPMTTNVSNLKLIKKYKEKIMNQL